MRRTWEKLGLIVTQDQSVEWLAGGSGPCCVVPNASDPSLLDLYVSGRDTENRSRIGLAQFDLETETVVSVQAVPVLALGERGAFDENGTSYPSVVRDGERLVLYYTGWIRGVHVPWYNDLGIAVSGDGRSFERLSRAPGMPRTDPDALGIGSSCVLRDGAAWHMWYTRFERRDDGPGNHRSYYNIKHANSADGLLWEAEPRICVDFDHPSEYAIAKPCVVKVGDRFVMWYSRRGEAYRAGLAVSDDGSAWRRIDDRVGIDVSATGWDDTMLCYPHVVEAGEHFYMFYCGNGYGVHGLGVARASREAVLEMIDVN
jgi:predicted GH43/DUF377 family glycosyl hydrolase